MLSTKNYINTEVNKTQACKNGVLNITISFTSDLFGNIPRE